MALAAFLLGRAARAREAKPPRDKKGMWQIGLATFIAGGLMGGLFAGAANLATGLKPNGLLLGGVAIPLVMALFLLGGTLLAGFANHWLKAEDQEWWARCGAYMLRLVLLWPLVWGIVFYGPTFLSGLDFAVNKTTLAAAAGLLSGVFSLVDRKSVV